MGLLLPHIFALRVYPDMISLSVKMDHEQAGGGKRDEIKVFSKESRYRLFRLLHSLVFEKVTFITLTYPGIFPTDSKVYKRHLAEYRRRFEKKYCACKAIWRLEFQKRGAPHYHILYFDAPYIPVKAWSSLWADVVHSDDINHRKAGVHVRLVTGNLSRELISSYVGKYVGKVDEQSVSAAQQKPGRWWGKWNIEEPEPERIEMTESEAQVFIAKFLMARKRSDWIPPDPLTCTVFGEALGTDKTAKMARDMARAAQHRKRDPVG